MTAVRIPTGVDARAFSKRIEERFGVKLAGGQGPLEGQIFRLAHFGAIDELDTIAALAAIELVLVELGQPVTLGAAAAAASRVFQAETLAAGSAKSKSKISASRPTTSLTST